MRFDLSDDEWALLEPLMRPYRHGDPSGSRSASRRPKRARGMAAANMRHGLSQSAKRRHV